MFEQCGVDVQQTNAQGLTALDVVNMYTDPRTASSMKQVLQGQCVVFYLYIMVVGLTECVLHPQMLWHSRQGLE